MMAAMTDEEALLAAIIAAPDDDLPRLVYADWLDEHGQPDRSEFIRVQCRLNVAGRPAPGDAERAFELEEANRGRWLIGLPHGEGVVWTFRRGFPEVLEAPIDVFLERYDRFAAVPWVQHLSLFDVMNSSVRDFVNRPWSPTWTVLDFEEHPLAPTYTNSYDCTPAIAAIANCPQVRQLRDLWLTHFEFVPEGVRLLAASQYLDGLRRLGISGHPDDPRYAVLRARFGDRLWIS
jgi:uncharacterized protein (TIGR02996 family)